MSWFSSFMHPGRAYDKARNQEEKYYQQGQQTRQPFIQNGLEAGKGQQDMYKKLMNPEQLQNEWSQGYEESPYAHQLLEQNQTSGLDAASAMGLGGSSAALSNIQQGAGNIMQKDRQNYMDMLMQKYLAGANIGQNLYNQGSSQASQGANASQQMGQDAAGLKYGQSQAGGNMFGNILGNLGEGLGGYLTGSFGKGNYGRGMWSPYGGQ